MSFVVKICTKCKIEHPIGMFCKDKTKPDGLHSHCINCRRMTKDIYFSNEINVIKQKERIRQWSMNNNDRVLEKRKEYKSKNKEIIREKNRVYIKNRLSDPEKRIQHNIRGRLSYLIRRKFNVSSSEILKHIGCSALELKIYLETKFEQGMNWDNYGQNGWHIDHIIPISKASNIEEFYKLNHFSNLQPLWAEDNRKKGNR